MPEKNASSSRYAITLNNYTPETLAQLESVPFKYCCYALEEGESGTPHVQGYVVMPRTMRFSAMKKLLPVGTHFEAAKGSTQQNIAYCSKQSKLVELGTRPLTQNEKGAANADRFKAAYAAAKVGNFEEIPEDIRVRYYRTWKEIHKDYMPQVEDVEGTTGRWYYGASGVGKSRQARIDYPNAYFKMCNKWWDGYQGQENVIIDDIDLNHNCLGHHLKIWTDRYAFLAETKGGAIMIRPKVVVVTSQYEIGTIFTEPGICEALNRRFSKTHFPAPLAPGWISNAY